MSNDKPISIDTGLCVQCGLCGEVCPQHVPETLEVDGRKATRVNPERAGRCFHCGHCAAICPKGAVSVEGLPPETFTESRQVRVDPDELMDVFRERRSMRRFKAEPVRVEDLERIIEAALSAPSVGGRTTRGVITVVDPSKLKEMMALVHGFYDGLMRAMRNPISRFFVKRRVGERRFHAIDTFVRPGLKWYLHWYREDGRDEISRGAPVVMIFHGAVTEPAIDETCMVMATQAMTMATCLGVGSLMNGLVSPGCNRSAEVRELIGLPRGHEAFFALCLGYPRHRFKKTIRRPGGSVRFV